MHQGKAGKLPFVPESIGSHWSRRVQVDVVALNWQTRQLLMGECKWGHQEVNRQVVRELIERKTLRLLHDLADESETWQIHYAVFSRAGRQRAPTRGRQTRRPGKGC